MPEWPLKHISNALFIYSASVFCKSKIDTNVIKFKTYISCALDLTIEQQLLNCVSKDTLVKESKDDIHKTDLHSPPKYISV